MYKYKYSRKSSPETAIRTAIRTQVKVVAVRTLAALIESSHAWTYLYLFDLIRVGKTIMVMLYVVLFYVMLFDVAAVDFFESLKNV